MNIIPMHCLAYGEVGRVEELVGSTEDVRRLEEMGVRRGQAVEMLQPGSPCIVRLGGSRLCFRQTEGLGVLVTTAS
jgi:Fe2+ transport system protein FeoA